MLMLKGSIQCITSNDLKAVTYFVMKIERFKFFNFLLSKLLQNRISGPGFSKILKCSLKLNL